MAKLLASFALVLVASSVAAPDPTPRTYLEPRFGRDLLIVLEYEGEDAVGLWRAAEGEFEEVRTDAGEVLRVPSFQPALFEPGDRDPTSKGFTKLAEGRKLIVFELQGPKQDWKKIPRFAGSYELVHGGEERMVEVPFEEVHDPTPWDDEAMLAAGFQFEHWVSIVPQVHVRVTGDTFDLDGVILVDGSGNELKHSGRDFGGSGSVYEFDMLGELDAASLTAVFKMDDGTSVEIADLPDRDEFKKVKSNTLKKLGMACAVRRVEVREFEAEGGGDWELLRDYRWVDRKGAVLAIRPDYSRGTARLGARTTCRIPEDLPRGARLQIGVLVGSSLERVAFEYLDIPAYD